MIRVRFFALTVLLAALTPTFANAQTAGTFRDVQIRSIDLANNVLELHNFGTDMQALDGWRFCSHDEGDGFNYSIAGGLNGQSLNSGESLFVHWDDDATGANAINISDIGGAWIDDLDADTAGESVSIGIYDNPAAFGIASGLADHIQYSFEGVGGSFGGRRSTAADANLWGDVDDWISVDAGSETILLTADPFSGAASHTSASFTVAGVPEPSTFALLALSAIGLGSVRRRRA